MYVTVITPMNGGNPYIPIVIIDKLTTRQEVEISRIYASKEQRKYTSLIFNEIKVQSFDEYMENLK